MPPLNTTPNPEHLSGSIERVTFHSEASGFCVLRVKVKGHRDPVTVVGSAASVSAGEFIDCLGAWFNDRQHGLQFKARELKVVPPARSPKSSRKKDAVHDEKRITEVNTGIMVMPGDKLKKWLGRLNNSNAQGEYYLTDIIEMAVADRVAIVTSQPETADEVLGVNNRIQLSHLERVYQRQQANLLMEQGVTLRDPARFDLRSSIETLGQAIEIDINVIFEGKISIGSHVKIGANTHIKNSIIGDN